MKVKLTFQLGTRGDWWDCVGMISLVDDDDDRPVLCLPIFHLATAENSDTNLQLTNSISKKGKSYKVICLVSANHIYIAQL